MYISLLTKSTQWTLAISMLVQPILAAIPPEAVRAAPAEVVPQAASAAPKVASPAEPLTATVPSASSMARTDLGTIDTASSSSDEQASTQSWSSLQSAQWPPSNASFTVNSTVDAIDANPGNGICASASGVCTLRAAVMEANALSGTQTIAVQAGTYLLSIPGSDEDAALTGDLDITDDLVLVGESASTTIIDGNGLDRILDIRRGLFKGTNVQIANITVQNGDSPGAGGGIYVKWSEVAFQSVVIKNNSANAGGGLAAVGDYYASPLSTKVTFYDSLITGNIATGSGGGLYCMDATFVLQVTHVSVNSARGGGGIYVGGYLTMSNSSIHGNSATEDGGGILGRSTGGIYSSGRNRSNISSSVISNNHAGGNGGGFAGHLDLRSSTISGNSAAGISGGIFIEDVGHSTIRYSTITNNTGLTGAGLRFVGRETAGGVWSSIYVEDTIIAENKGLNCSISKTGYSYWYYSQGYNLENTNTCRFTQSTDLINSPPRLKPLADNGGPTFTHALEPTSPAIDKGLGGDQRGAPIVDGDGDGVVAGDIGAFEFASYPPGPLPDISVTHNPNVQDKTGNSSGDNREKCLSSDDGLTYPAGDPINTRTGGVDYVMADLSFPVLGGQMVFERYYSSLVTSRYTEPLGPGWTHNQDTNLIFPTDPDGIQGQVRFKPHSGNLLIFYINENGTYTPYNGVLARLEAIPDGYRITSTCQWVYTFDPQGRLTSWLNAQGHEWTYIYESSSGPLVRIEEASSGLGLDLGYNAAGQLVSITDPENRTVGYSYDANGDLSTVTDLRGQTWTYSYSQHRLVEVVNPLGQTVEHIVYDAQGRAIKQYDQLGWPHGAPAPVGPPVVTLDYSSYDIDGKVVITDALGNQMVAIYDNERGILLTLQEPTDPATDNPAKTNRDMNFRPTSVTDENGSTTSMTWDSTNLKRVTDANGNTTSLTHDSYNHLTMIRNAAGVRAFLIYNTEHIIDPATGQEIDNPRYNSNLDGDLLLQRVDNYQNGIFDPIVPDEDVITNYYYTTSIPKNLLARVERSGTTTCYGYNSLGQQETVIQNCVQPPTGTPGENLTTTTTYDDIGRVLTITNPQSRATLYTYLDADNRADVVTTNFDATKDPYEDGIFNLSTRTMTDELGRVVETISNYWEGQPAYYEELYNFSTRTFYDDAGRVIATVSNYEDPTGGDLTAADIAASFPDRNKVTRTYYDAAGRVVASVHNFVGDMTSLIPPAFDMATPDRNIVTRAYYDESGRIVATINNYNEADLPGSGSPQHMDFDADGNTDATLEVSPEATEFNQISLTRYDPAGRVVQTISSYDGSDLSDPGNYYKDGVYNLVTATEYDKTGNVTKTIANFAPVATPEAGDMPVWLGTSAADLVWIRLDPNTPDLNQITCTHYDKLNRPDFVRSACWLPDDLTYSSFGEQWNDYQGYLYTLGYVVFDDYKSVGDNLYNMVNATYYDNMDRQIASVSNYEDPDNDGQLILSATRNFISRTYYNESGRVAYVVENFVGDISDPTPPSYDPATPDRNLVTRTLYDELGRQIVTIRNLWNPDGGALTEYEIQAGYPDRNLVGYIHYNAFNQIDWAVDHFVGDLSSLGDTPPDFNVSYPDQNLLTRFTYDVTGRRHETTIDRGGEPRASHTDFDVLGRTSQTFANYQDGIPGPTPDVDVRTSYAYQALGRITETIDPEGRVRRSISEQLDPILGRISLSIVDPGGLALTTTSVSDAAGRVVRSIDASGHVTATRYDAQDRAIQTITDPDGLALTTSTTYDLLGQTVTSTNSEGTTTRYKYDNLGRLRVVFENYVAGQADSAWPACQYDIDAVNVCTRYGYDDAGNLTSTVLGNGSGTIYEYDALGQMTRETVDPGGEEIVTDYAYDAAGNQVTMTRDPGGASQQITITFHDRLGRTTGIDYVGTDGDVVYSYDAWGNRASMLDAGGTWTYLYDAMNHLTSVTNPQSIEVAYEYDATGNRTDLDAPGMEVDYTYDPIGRLDTISNPFGSGMVDYAYDGSSRLLSAALPNGASTTNSYDPIGRLEEILNSAGPNSLSTFHYTLDERGNRTDAAEMLKTPVVSILLSPANGSTTADLTPTFDWSDVAAATRYQLQVDDSADFSSPVLNVQPVASIYTPGTALAAGTYYWRVRTRDEMSIWGQYSNAWMVTINGQLPAAPALIAPADGSTTSDLTPTFDWDNVADASRYQLQVDNDADFSSLALNVQPTTSTYTPGIALAAGTYYWRVRTRDSMSTWGDYGAAWSFVVDGVLPAAPVLLAPADAATTADLTPTFDWSDVAGASRYQLQVADNIDFTGLALNVQPTTSTYISGTPLAAGTYYWHIRTQDITGTWGAYSPAWTVIIDGVLPAAPALLAPADGSTTADLTPTFDWADVADASRYQLQVAGNPGFTGPALNVQPTTSTYTSGTPLAAGTYYWHVRTQDITGTWGAYGPAWTVIIDGALPAAPTLLAPADGSTTADLTPTFDWADVADASRYQLQVADNPGFTGPALNVQPTTSTYTSGTPLAADTYYWHIRTQDITGTWGAYGPAWTVIIDGALPAAPTSLAPADGSTTADLTPTFDWSDVADASRYQLQVADNPGFTGPALNVQPTTSTYTSGTALAAGTYYWHVRTQDNTGTWGTWGAAWTVILDGVLPAAPTLLAPADASTTTDLTPTFDWSDVTGATRYQLQVDDNADFSSLALNVQPTTSTYTTTAALAVGAYSWRVRTLDSTGTWGAWGTAWTVILDGALPAAPTLLTPADASTTADLTPTFDWSDVTGATRYQLQVDDNADFSSLALNVQPTTSTYTATAALAVGAYSWRVRTLDGTGTWGAWGTAWTVVLDASTATPIASPAPTDTPTPTEAQPGPDGNGAPINPFASTGHVASTTHGLLAPAQEETGTPTPTPTATPTATPTPTATAMPTATESPTPTPSLTPTPTETEMPTPSPTPTAPAIPTPAPDGVPELNRPAGDGIPSQPAFEWLAVVGATDYHLQVFDAADNSVVDAWYDAVATCFEEGMRGEMEDMEGFACAASPALTLAPGSYTWRMQTRVAGVDGSWSAHVGFTVGTPRPVDPAGDLGDWQPSFWWVGVEGALQYQVQVFDAGDSPVVDIWYDDADICVHYEGGYISCEPPSPATFAAGAYHWQVRARDTGGDDPWSGSKSFTVGSPRPYNPRDLVDTLQPAYQWDAVDAATDYRLQVFDAASSTLVDAWYAAAEVCQWGTCLVDSPAPLSPGFYAWRVQGRAAAGDGPWSEVVIFSAGVPGPDEPYSEDIFPIGEPLTVIWSQVDGAAEYQLHVADTGGSLVVDTWYDAADNCAEGQCTVTPPVAMAPDFYLWRVRVRAGGIEGSWSLVKGFRVGAPEAYEPTWRVGQNPEYMWSPVAGATGYDLKVLDRENAIVIDAQYAIGDIWCHQEMCTVIPATTLALGDEYRWRVRARFGAVEGPWSNTMGFDVVPAPDAPVTVSPQGSGIGYTPTYTWNAVSGTLYYELKVFDSRNSLILYDGYDDLGTICVYGACRVTPADPLPRGDYRWHVRAIVSGYVMGDWSPDLSFHVGPVPGAVTLTAPQGDLTETQPTYSWQEVFDTTRYQVQVLDAQDVVVVDTWVDAATACIGGTCQATPAVTLARGDYHWRVRGENIDGLGMWSDPMSFTLWMTPGAATPISPQGDGVDYSPTYTWTAALQGAQYQVQVVDAQDAVVVDQWFEAADICAEGACQATPWYGLERGDHRWQVRAQNPSGLGPWSAEMSFTVGPLPGAVTPGTPQGDGIDAQPTYYWEGGDYATRYHLLVSDDLGTAVVDEVFDAGGGVCDYEVGIRCWATPSTTLNRGGYRWRVQAENDDGLGPWSPEMSFVVGLLPGEVTPVSPEGENISGQPTYTWIVVEGDTTQYQLRVYDAQSMIVIDEQVDAAAVCADGICSSTPAMALERGGYSWQARARNASGLGPWSAEISFIVGPLPAVATLIAPEGYGADAQPTYNWDEVADTTRYQLQVTDGQDEIVVDAWFDAADVCSIGTCVAASAITLVRSSHHWRVRTQNASGDGPWSAEMSFVVGNLPDAATLISPEGYGAAAQPTYTWNEVDDTTRFQVQVTDAQDEIVVDEWVDAANACSGATCSATPSVTLVRSNHHWRVRTQNASGDGPWSAEMSFVVGNLPAAATLLSPQGDGFDAQPAYTWNEVNDTAEYHVVVRDAQGTARVDRWVEAADVCTSGACLITPLSLLDTGSYHWQVRTQNASGTGPWSEDLSFTVGAVAGAPVLIGPMGTDTTLPTYRWNEVASTTNYQLVVYDEGNQSVTDRTYTAADICQEGICQTQAARLAVGNYHWWVRASSASNTTPWSIEMRFTVAEPADSRSYDWHYEYDKLNRLTYACSIWDSVARACNGDELRYEYDGAGNLLRFDKLNATDEQVETLRFVINGANQITCIDADASHTCNGSETIWQYDEYGNLTSDDTSTYQYDTANRLASIANDAGTTTYQYNGDGNRVAQTVNGVATTYVLDTATPLTMVLAETTGSETTRYWHGLDTLAQSDGTTTGYFAYDALGSVRQLSDVSGAVGLTQTFDPYGNGYAKAGSVETAFGYTGEQVDENGFVYLRARYYNPAHGRFFQMDTWQGDLDQPLSMNPYLYSHGNPIMFTDPSGYCVFAAVDTIACAMLAGAVVGGLFGTAFAGVYADWIYTLVENGECGCVEEEQVLAFTRAQWVARAMLAGAAMGFIFGGIAAIGAGPALIVALAGMGISSHKVIANAMRVRDDPENKCAWLDLGVSLFGLFSSAYGVLRAYKVGSTEGWIRQFPAKAPSDMAYENFVRRKLGAVERYATRDGKGGWKITAKDQGDSVQLDGVQRKWINEMKSGYAHPEREQTLRTMEIAESQKMNLRIVIEDPDKLSPSTYYALYKDAQANGFSGKIQLVYAPFGRPLQEWIQFVPSKGLLDALGLTP